MTAHELAQKLINGPDKPVTLAVACSQDTVISDISDKLSVSFKDGVIELRCHIDQSFKVCNDD